jgi:hypothetical protein
MKKIIIFVGVTLFSLYSGKVLAQNTTNTPASMFGLGELVTNETGQYSGMGGVGIAMRADNYLNSSNPAAITALDTCKFVWEMGLLGKYETYSSGNAHSDDFEGNFSNIALGFRPSKRWAVAVGLAPYSSMGYAVTEVKSVEGGTPTYTSSLYQGNGGVSKIYITNAFKVSDNMSLGVNLDYFLGRTVESEIMDATTIQLTSNKQAFYADFGLQYILPLDKTQSLTFGAIYGFKQNIRQRNTRTVADTDGGTGSTTAGVHKKGQILPQYFGAGVAWTKKRLTLTGDYRYVQWSSMKSDVVSFTDQNIINVGGVYKMGNLYKEPCNLMAGLGYENSYMTKSGTNPKTYSVSAGVGIPVVSKNLLTLGVKYSFQPSSATKFEQTNSLSLFLNISFHEKSVRYRIE